MELLDGKSIAQDIRARVRDAVTASGRTPCLATVLVGDDRASRLYQSLKEKACADTGIRFLRKDFAAVAAPEDVVSYIQELNDNPDVHGILIQLPLPKGWDPDEIVAAMDPKKDVDGFHPQNLAALEQDDSVMLPVLVKAVFALLLHTDVHIAGANVCILGNSNVFVQPFQHLFSRAGASVHTAKSADTSLTHNADILLTALGQPHTLHALDIQPNAVVLDVGITPTPHGVHGDVDPEGLDDIPGWLTPVPGGVGPMTVAMLMENTALAAGVPIHNTLTQQTLIS